MNVSRVARSAALTLLVVPSCGGGAETMPVAGPSRPRPSLAPIEAPVRACVLASACARPEDPIGLRDAAACVERLIAHRAHDSILGCLERTRTCRDVDFCLGRDRPEDAKRVCDARPGVIVFCDGDRLVNCEGERPRMTNCGDVNGVCREHRVASGILVRGCFSSALCPDGAPAQRCDAVGGIVACQQGLVERTRCPSGTRCVESPGASGEVEPSCVPVGTRPCVPGSASRCDGSTLVSCLVGDGARGVLVTTDCAAAGLRCASDGASASCVVDDACAPGPPRCEGRALRFCAAGTVVRAHCERYGLGPCKEDGQRAACTVR